MKKEELINRLKELQKETTMLYDLGVISISSANAERAHLTIELFLELAGEDFNAEKLAMTDYPHKITKNIDGLDIFALLTEEEAEALKQGPAKFYRNILKV